MTTSLLILAAGMGSRFGDTKQIVKVSARKVPLLFFAIEDAIAAGVNHVVVVTRSDLMEFFQQEICSHFPGISFEFAIQEMSSFCPSSITQIVKNRQKPWGTAHATLTAKNILHGKFLLINADDYYGKSAIQDTVQFMIDNKIDNNLLQTWACMAYNLGNTLSPNGTVSRSFILSDDDIFVKKFVEHHGILNDQSRIIDSNLDIFSENTLASMNLFALDDRIFTFLEQQFSQFLEESLKNDTILSAEFGLPQNILAAGVPVKILRTQEKWVGMTYKSDLELVNKFLEER